MSKLALWMDKQSRAARTVPQALALLRSMPGGSNIGVPLRYGNKDDYESTISTRELNAKIDAAPIKSVPVSGLVAIQHTVNADRVAQHLEDFGLHGKGARHSVHGGVIDVPIVVQKNGTKYLHDGHHRTTAEILLGGRRIRARYVDLDNAA